MAGSRVLFLGLRRALCCAALSHPQVPGGLLLLLLTQWQLVYARHLPEARTLLELAHRTLMLLLLVLLQLLLLLLVLVRAGGWA
jgi:hypothetical protein